MRRRCQLWFGAGIAIIRQVRSLVGSKVPFRSSARAGDPPVGTGRPTRRRLVGALRTAAIAGLAGTVLLAIGLVPFAVPPPAKDNGAPTDAIVVLTGGSLRLRTGVELLRDGRARVLFVSGVDERVGLDAVLRSAGEETSKWLVCCIVLGQEAENTSGNAIETAQWMRGQGFHSLRLVTSWWHMPRSLLDFERAMPDFEIVPHPVFPEHFKQQHWWSQRGMPSAVIVEYGKYLAALFLPFVDRSALGGSHLIGVEAR
jgi:uncharacterized SAM-binding protein YcdF (DUF218 family)